MNRTSLGFLGSLALVFALGGSIAQAEERHGGPEHHGGPERRGEARERHEAHEFYRSRHMVFDNRHHHGHYYPVPGYSVSVLPPGNLSITFGRGRFFFHSGVWYRPGPAGFVVVRPPIGIVVPVLPLGYSTVWAGGIPYYYANDVYYTGAPGNYVVAAPPATVMAEMPDQPPPAQAPAPDTTAAPVRGAGNWYYCDSAEAYYPYVSSCREGWRTVPATPPSPR